MRKKILSVVGARPQFIKCIPLSKEIRKKHTEILLHTGQHYNFEMSDIFFDELNIPAVDYNLCIGSGNHGEQTGKMIIEIEKVLMKEIPDLVIVYGDTNSTIAGALAAAKLHIRVAHVEAGLRSFDRSMPEEINRVITDHISNILFCPTQTAVNNLSNEGIENGIYLVGDIMADSLEYYKKVAEKKSGIIEKLGIEKEKYFVITLHRPSNTESKENITSILEALEELGKVVVFPVHPRTDVSLRKYKLLDKIPRNVIMTKALGYLDMIMLMAHAEKILTDSGGIQKESYMLKVPCITLRENTEWIETLENGWNVLVGADKEKIINAAISKPIHEQGNIFGNLCVSKRIMNTIDDLLEAV